MNIYINKGIKHRSIGKSELQMYTRFSTKVISSKYQSRQNKLYYLNICAILEACQIFYMKPMYILQLLADRSLFIKSKRYYLQHLEELCINLTVLHQSSLYHRKKTQL